MVSESKISPDVKLKPNESQIIALGERPLGNYVVRNETGLKPLEQSEVKTQDKIGGIRRELSELGDNEKLAETNNAQKPNILVEQLRILNFFFNVKVLGEENINAIPRSKNVIIATTHIENLAVVLAINGLGKHFEHIVAAKDSSHFNILQDPVNNLGHFVGSKDRFRVDHDRGKKYRRGRLDPDNFVPMKKSLEEGKPLIIAAYHDPAYLNNANELPEKPGNGAAYLAQITKDAIILPVAVDIKLDKPLRGGKFDIFRVLGRRLAKGRIKADVIIGKPLVLDHIEGIERMEEILRKRKSGKSIMKEELREFSSLTKQLKEQSKIIMQRLAELLPPEKRGVWNINK